VFVPTRGDPSISWADFDGTALHCTAGATPFPLCDDAHRLTSLYDDPDLLALPNEPFSVFADAFQSVDPAGNPVMHGFAMVGHLASGAVTLIDAPAPSSDTKVQITDILTGVFGDPSTSARGATSITALRPCDATPSRAACAPPPRPGPGEGFPELAPEMLYIASNSDNRVQLFNVGMRDGGADYLLPGTFFRLDAVGTMAGQSSDSRSVQFSADGQRLYLVNRAPPSLQVYDTSIGPDGAPRNALLGSSDLCREATAAAVAGVGRDERVYVTCFQDGQIYAVDPFGQSQVEDIITVGRGPYAVDVLPPQNSAMAPPPQYLFVSNFLEDTIAVIDIAPNSPTRHRVVLRIGTPRAP
jgi:DNA-binding beta-propeller fold protein YncE